jgi:quinoprotein glucose dehydrogenase
MTHRTPLLAGAILASLTMVAGCGPTPHADHDWPAHGGGPDHRQFSRATQITPANVSQLQVAWTYRTGDARDDNRSQIQCNPVVIGGVLYGTSAQLKVFALDAATGAERWVFDPFAGQPPGQNVHVNRGVTYWTDGSSARIFSSAGPYLHAIDAATGLGIESFGTGGRVNLREGLGRDVSNLRVVSTTPGTIYKDLLIVTTSLGEGPAPVAPGHIRAYDVRTGERRWIFHTIPHPGEPGSETWPPDAWTRIGGANNWAGLSVDEERGLAFIPTGSAAFDFWGGNRLGANLYANSLIALKADTGEYVWHFQFVHHDIWDRDLPAAPVLGRVTLDGVPTDIVAQTTKTGHVFVFDRETGRPIFPIEEKPIPASTLEGEEAWPTQPEPARPPPLTRQVFSLETVTDISPESRANILAQITGANMGHPWQPPSVEGTVIFPGFDGGAEWGGASFDPATGWLYVNTNEMPWITRMVKVDRASAGPGAPAPTGQQPYQLYCAACHGLDRRGDAQRVFPAVHDVQTRLTREEVEAIILKGKGVMPAQPALTAAEREQIVAYLFGDTPPLDADTANRPSPDIPYAFGGYTRLLDQDGYPGITPPWGRLNAVDLARGEIVWQVPLGEFEALTQRGIPQTGTENYGGPVATAGGVVFIGATQDEKFRAFDARTGAVLWETTLPAGGYATPAVYEAGGRQFVVIAAGGGKMGTKSGDTYVAFALPE